MVKQGLEAGGVYMKKVDFNGFGSPFLAIHMSNIRNVIQQSSMPVRAATAAAVPTHEGTEWRIVMNPRTGEEMTFERIEGLPRPGSARPLYETGYGMRA
jgi:hypothetical protein